LLSTWELRMTNSDCRVANGRVAKCVVLSTIRFSAMADMINGYIPCSGIHVVDYSVISDSDSVRMF